MINLGKVNLENSNFLKLSHNKKKSIDRKRQNMLEFVRPFEYGNSRANFRYSKRFKSYALIKSQENEYLSPLSVFLNSKNKHHLDLNLMQSMGKKPKLKIELFSSNDYDKYLNKKINSIISKNFYQNVSVKPSTFKEKKTNVKLDLKSSKWTCMICLSKHKMEVKICSICGSQKHNQKVSVYQINDKKLKTIANQTNSYLKTWLCSYCNYANDSLKIFCMSCRSSKQIQKDHQVYQNIQLKRSHKEGTKKFNIINEYVFKKDKQNASSHNSWTLSANSSKWTFSVCSLSNDENKKTCISCTSTGIIGIDDKINEDLQLQIGTNTATKSNELLLFQKESNQQKLDSKSVRLRPIIDQPVSESCIKNTETIKPNLCGVLNKMPEFEQVKPIFPIQNTLDIPIEQNNLFSFTKFPNRNLGPFSDQQTRPDKSIFGSNEIETKPLFSFESSEISKQTKNSHSEPNFTLGISKETNQTFNLPWYKSTENSKTETTLNDSNFGTQNQLSKPNSFIFKEPYNNPENLFKKFNPKDQQNNIDFSNLSQVLNSQTNESKLVRKKAIRRLRK